MEFPLFDFEIRWLKHCILPPTKQRDPKSKRGETCSVANNLANTPTPKSKLKFNTMILSYPMSILSPQTWNLLFLAPCFTFVKIMKRWSRWSSEAEVQQWDACPEPTESRLIGYVTESIWARRSKSITLTPKTNSQTYWQKAISHVMSGTIFSVCSISAFSALPAALKQCRKGYRKKQEKKELCKSQDRRWTWSRVLWQVLRLCKV